MTESWHPANFKLQNPELKEFLGILVVDRKSQVG